MTVLCGFAGCREKEEEEEERRAFEWPSMAAAAIASFCGGPLDKQGRRTFDKSNGLW